MSSVSSDERGQATIELAVVLPVVLVALLAVVAVVRIGVDRVVVVLAAREGARAAAAGASPDEATARARGAAGDGDVSVTVSPDSGAGTVTVKVTRVRSPDVPLVSAVMPSEVTVGAAVTMRLER